MTPPRPTESGVDVGRLFVIVLRILESGWPFYEGEEVARARRLLNETFEDEVSGAIISDLLLVLQKQGFQMATNTLAPFDINEEIVAGIVNAVLAGDWVRAIMLANDDEYLGLLGSAALREKGLTPRGKVVG